MAGAPLSQIAVGDEGLMIYGRLVNLNACGLLLSLESLPAREEVIAPGRSSHVTLNMAHGNYQIPGTVISYERDAKTLLVGFTESIQPAQRRRAQRFSIAISMSVRPRYDDGRIDPWQQVTSKDLSVGGTRLELVKCIAAPSAADIKFRLPEQRNELKISCRVAHARQFDIDGRSSGSPFLL